MEILQLEHQQMVHATKFPGKEKIMKIHIEVEVQKNSFVSHILVVLVTVRFQVKNELQIRTKKH